MSENIHNILNQLGTALVAEITAANDRANAIKAQHAKLIDGLGMLLRGATQPGSNDNQTGIVEVERDVPEVAVAPIIENKGKGKRQSLPDAVFIDVLTHEWIGAGDIFKRLNEGGHKVAEGTIYNRMRKIADNRSDIIEAMTKPECWRLKGELAKSDGKTPPRSKDIVHSKNATKAAPRNDVLPVVQRQPANDDEAQVYKPVLHRGDCLEVMRTIPDGSVDLILADLPYGTTRLSIDHIIQMEPLWAEYRRIIKPRGNIVLFASQPFTTALINAGRDIFKYSLVWKKQIATGFMDARIKPLKSHEDILVFCQDAAVDDKHGPSRPTYNPQGAREVKKIGRKEVSINYLDGASTPSENKEYIGIANCPRSVLEFAKVRGRKGEKSHPFAKPLDLLEYLIRTYSNAGEVVLDNTMGSGSTCIAAMSTGRRSIGIEQTHEWFEFASQRVESALPPTMREVAVKPIEPISKSAQAQIVQGDCLEVMKQMPSKSVDLIVTSPPYNLNLKRRGGMKNTLWPNAKLANGYRSHGDDMPHDEYVAWIRDVMNEGWRLLSDDGAIFMNHKPRIQKGKLWTPLDLNLDLPVRQIVIWDRGSGMNFNRSFCTPSHEWIVIYAKPNFRFSNGRPRDVWQFPPAQKNAHPAPFPVELPLNAIQHTNAKVVLDPFAGSGTTGVAALRCGRKFIGIELDEQYAADAMARIEAESRMKVAA